MDLNGLHRELDNSIMPDYARADLKAIMQKTNDLGNGVNFFSGHDNGVAYRFFYENVENEYLSAKLKYKKYEPVEMIQWLVDSKFLKPVEQVKFLPEGLLTWDIEVDPVTGKEISRTCVGGLYAENYLRFKQGMEAPGTPLSKWDEIDPCDMQTLVSAGIFSVEQFAACSDEKVARYHDSIKTAHQRAIYFVNGKENRVDAEKIASQLLEAERSNSKLRDEMDAMKTQMEALLARSSGEGDEDPEPEIKTKRGRPAKVTGEE